MARSGFGERPIHPIEPDYLSASAYTLQQRSEGRASAAPEIENLLARRHTDKSGQSLMKASQLPFLTIEHLPRAQRQSTFHHLQNPFPRRQASLGATLTEIPAIPVAVTISSLCSIQPFLAQFTCVDDVQHLRPMDLFGTSRHASGAGCYANRLTI